MDPISQGAIGAALAQTSSRTQRLGWIALFGCAAGLAPDLDVLVQSATDPLLFLEYHRQFSHSLLFIPIGALLVTSVLLRLPRQPLRFGTAYRASLAGYATHGLLDACTSYGTQLFWPFSDVRIAWNTISIIDPLFTLPVLGLTLWAACTRRRALATAAVAWALLYLSVGAAQLARVTLAAKDLASTRKHDPQQLLVKPAFGNLLLWKSLYQSQGRYWVDGYRAALGIGHCGGEQIERLQLARDLPMLQADSQQARDLERFRWFSMDYLARFREPVGHGQQAVPAADSDVEALIIDVRYSHLPNQIAPMWGIRLSTAVSTASHVQWWAQRNVSGAQRARFGQLLAGTPCTPTDLALVHKRSKQ